MEILLKEVMKKNHLSIRQVSLWTGISKSAVDRIARGEESPTMDQMEALEAGLGVKISDLYRSDFQ